MDRQSKFLALFGTNPIGSAPTRPTPPRPPVPERPSWPIPPSRPTSQLARGKRRSVRVRVKRRQPSPSFGQIVVAGAAGFAAKELITAVREDANMTAGVKFFVLLSLTAGMHVLAKELGGTLTADTVRAGIRMGLK